MKAGRAGCSNSSSSRTRSVGNREIQAGDLRPALRRAGLSRSAVGDLLDGYAKDAMPEEFTGGLGDCRRPCAARVRLARRHAGFSEPLHRIRHRGSGREGEECPRRRTEPRILRAGVAGECRTGHEATRSRSDCRAKSRSGASTARRGSTKDAVVARYPDARILASGWLLGEKLLAGRAALVDARMGQGHVILFGMRPQYRGQSYQTFKLFFNSLLE